ncbi:MAG: hypothetical protein IMY72_11910 [Bacteroidetes bacterium]|nr:hypothetical protein [Bacteroidota bacterium]
MRRAVSIDELFKRKFKVMDFTGKWKDAVGKPEAGGAWLVWGNSSQGKTRFSIQLAKYLSNFGRVAYNPLEEGISESFKKAIIDENITSKNRIIFLDKEPIDELEKRLKKQKSPNFIIIDSLQYTGMTYNDYKKIRDEFPHKVFIFISHADGREPAGRVAKSVRYDVSVKIRVEGYKAFPQSRYGGGEPYVIWEEGANKYWVE